MPVVKLSTSQQLALQKHLSDDLADDALVKSAYDCVIKTQNERTATHALILVSGLQSVLDHDPELVALTLLHKLAELKGLVFIESLSGTSLEVLQKQLKFFAPVPRDAHKFKKLTDRWQVEANALINEPDTIKVIKLACLADSIHRKEWHNFLQKHYLIERACVFIEKLQGSQGLVPDWLGNVKAAITASTNSPIRMK